MDLDHHPVAEGDAFLGRAGDQLAEHGDGGQQALDVAEQNSGLAAVRCYNGNGGDLTGAEITPPVFEAGEIHGDGSEDEGLTAASADHQPGFAIAVRGGFGASSALSKQLPLLIGEREAEQGSEEASPGLPTLRVIEEGLEQVLVIDGVKDSDSNFISK